MCGSRRLRGSSCTLLLGSMISSSSRPLENIRINISHHMLEWGGGYMCMFQRRNEKVYIDLFSHCFVNMGYVSSKYIICCFTFITLASACASLMMFTSAI